MRWQCVHKVTESRWTYYIGPNLYITHWWQIHHQHGFPFIIHPHRMNYPLSHSLWLSSPYWPIVTIQLQWRNNHSERYFNLYYKLRYYEILYAFRLLVWSLINICFSEILAYWWLSNNYIVFRKSNAELRNKFFMFKVQDSITSFGPTRYNTSNILMCCWIFCLTKMNWHYEQNLSSLNQT